LEERGDERADELHEEGRAWGDLDVVPELEVLDKGRRLRERLYRVRLEYLGAPSVLVCGEDDGGGDAYHVGERVSRK
jgi:hypothetical protein